MRLAIILGLSALTSLTAQAADLSVKNPAYKAPPAASSYNWSGFYLGGFVDYGANFGNSFTTATPTTTTIDLNQTPHGPGVGGFLEALYQPGGSDWVFGVGAEISYANLQATGSISQPNLGTISFSNATNYLGSVYGVLGYTLAPQLLAYVNGGFGFGGAHPNLTDLVNSQAITDTSVGWKAGVGLRYAVASNVAVGIEGDYYQLGDKALSIVIPPVTTPVMTSTAKYGVFEQKLTLGLKF